MTVSHTIVVLYLFTSDLQVCYAISFFLHVEALSWKEEAICEYDVETPIFSGQKPM